MLCNYVANLYLILLRSYSVALVSELNMTSPFLIRILAWDFAQIDPSWGTKYHSDPYWRLYINKHEGASLELSSIQYQIIANRIHLVPSWIQIRCHSTSYIDHFYIHFELLGISGPIVRAVFNSPICLSEKTGFDDISEELRGKTDNVVKKDMAALCYVKSLVYKSISTLLSCLPPEEYNRIERFVSGDSQISPILDYIDSHLSGSLNNDYLAGLSYMSTSNFIRRFRKATGQTPAEYVLERRIAAAAQELTYSDSSIEQIATKLGFSNRFYFTRAFSKIMRVPPAAYRKMPKI